MAWSSPRATFAGRRPAQRHAYTPRGACAQAWRERATEVLIAGPAGTGKSRAALEKLHTMMLSNPGAAGLIVRKTHASLGSTALKTWREHVIAESLTGGHVHFYGGSAEEPPQYRYTNGAKVMIGGMDNPTKIMSSDYDMVYVQEATELTETDWEFLTTRLRNGRTGYVQLLADCNPDRPTHFLKSRADRGDLVMLHSKHTDNPRLYGPDGSRTPEGESYLAILDKLTGVRRLRLRDGKWAAAEGLIYEGWDPAVHLVDDFPVPLDWPRYWSVDFGYVNPFVLQCWAQDPDGRLVLYREIYRTKQLVQDHAAHILRLVRRPAEHVESSGREPDPRRPDDWMWTEPQPTAIFADHDAEGRATFERETGLSTRPAHKAVTEGIQKFDARLSLAGDGLPRLLIQRGCLVERDTELDQAKKPCCTAEEIPGYVWDTGGGKKPKETPLKLDDHGCDAGRYVVAGVDLTASPNIRWL